MSALRFDPWAALESPPERRHPIDPPGVEAPRLGGLGGLGGGALPKWKIGKDEPDAPLASDGAPSGPCPDCGGGRWWRLSGLSGQRPDRGRASPARRPIRRTGSTGARPNRPRDSWASFFATRKIAWRASPGGKPRLDSEPSTPETVSFDNETGTIIAGRPSGAQPPCRHAATAVAP